MGNMCRPPRPKSTSTLVFVSDTSSAHAVSLTVPSVCSSPSFHLSVKRSVSEAPSDTFTWAQMEALYLKQEEYTFDSLSPPSLKAAAEVIDFLKAHLAQLCFDLEKGSVKLPEPLAERFETAYSIRYNRSSQSYDWFSDVRKLVVHFLSVLYVHEKLLNVLRLKDIDSAADIAKQIAVAHALKGISPRDFRFLDWFLIHYSMKTNLISDENIASVSSYLNTVSNYIKGFYETQSVLEENTTVFKKDHRDNKARENYRLMKKWYALVSSFKDREQRVEMLLTEQIRLRQEEEDTRTIDTLVLKEKDFIMKHFVDKPFHTSFSRNEPGTDVAPTAAWSGPQYGIISGLSAATLQSYEKSLSKASSKSSKNYFA